MKAGILTAAVGLLAQVVPSLALIPKPPLTAAGIQRRSRGIKQHTHPKPDLVNNGTFDQLLDHSDPSKGTFKQRFWWDASHWKGPGYPIFLFNVGETAADGYTGYLEEGTLTGHYAKELDGAVIVIEREHSPDLIPDYQLILTPTADRYWGESNPFTELTAETLQFLDLPQSVFDMTYFAKNVPLEFDATGGRGNAPHSPWVLVGGSYPGALAAWTSIIDPGTFWAYHASSAVVEAIYDFYPYFEAVERAIPRNCSSDVRAVIGYVDRVFAEGTAQDIYKLKAMFGLENLEHHDDFAAALATPLWSWQGDEETVFDFCDYIEGSAYSTGSNGIGLEAAIPAYAAYINSTTDCHKYDCSTYNPRIKWNDPTDLDNDRQWNWMLCHNPFAWWQVGPPSNDGKHVVSSQLRPDHFQRQCALMFPETNGYMAGSNRGWTTKHLNRYTGGWDAKFERVMFVNGEFDPWIEATVGSHHRPGGPRVTSEQTPIFVIENGNHVPELIINDVPEEVSVLPQQVAIMKKWLSEWKAS